MATFDVILPVKNGGAYLVDAVRSIQEQSFKDWRLLILDHGSDDGSDRLAHIFAEGDKRIEVHSMPHAGGLAELLNAGLALCDCRYVMRQDADDVSLGGRMETVLRVFTNSPRLLVVGGEATAIDSRGRQIGYLRKPSSPTAITAASFFYNPILHPAATMNFEALNRVGGVYGKDILHLLPANDSIVVPGLAEDYVLFGQMALLGPCANLRAPLIKYRLHEASVSKSSIAEQINLSLRISRFLARSFCLRNGDKLAFDPAPFCNHADYVFDFRADDYSGDFRVMAQAMRKGLGPSPDLERELAFRWVLANRRHAPMIRRYVDFEMRYGATPAERRTVRNWLLRGVRRGKYVYRDDEVTPGGGVHSDVPTLQ
ncbi:MAG: glycosyltransferase family 2 protein [Alphaproteobacteria bacterium]|nr:glycosyltransferase family 2 protein [Alphaproteobacteria bacterium]